MRTIVALGNPGPEYDGTRHNAGFLLADHLAARWRLGAFKRDGRARTARGEVRGQSVELVKPTTYMNRSGAALAPRLADPTFDPGRDLLVLVDDTALDVGRYRLRAKGSAGGHNGLKSIEGTLRSGGYARLRIGVGPRPPEYDDLADYVLDRLSEDEKTAIDSLLDPMADAVECWVVDGIDIAMNRFNRAARSGDEPPADSADSST